MSLSPALVVVLAMLLFGKAFSQTGLLPENTPEVLNKLVLWLLLPALVLKAVRGLEFHSDLIVLVVTPWLLLLVSTAVVLLLARLCAWPRPVVGCLLLCTALGNTAFLGYPMVEATLGREALPYAVVYDQLGSFIALSSYGLIVVAIYRGDARPSARRIVRQVLTFPAFLALVIGLLPLPQPEWLQQLIDTLAGLLVPIAIFAVGFQLKLVPPWHTAGPTLAGLSIKLLLLPAIAYAFARLAGADTLVVAVNTLQSAMPAMITAGALASDARLAPEVAASLVGYGILIAVFWLPLLGSWMLQSQ